MDFTGKVALITGAAGNLGKAVADAFDAAGARQVLVDIDDGVLNKVYGAGNDRRYTVAANLLDEASTKRAADAALAKFGRIEILCNIAGGSARRPYTKRRPRPGSGCSTSTRRRWSIPPGRSCRR
jgi:NAD(P)-dependent dehydrogenase (short-subunit alcohol dehydrogenase family)